MKKIFFSLVIIILLFSGCSQPSGKVTPITVQPTYQPTITSHADVVEEVAPVTVTTVSKPTTIPPYTAPTMEKITHSHYVAAKYKQQDPIIGRWEITNYTSSDGSSEIIFASSGTGYAYSLSSIGTFKWTLTGNTTLGENEYDIHFYDEGKDTMYHVNAIYNFSTDQCTSMVLADDQHIVRR